MKSRHTVACPNEKCRGLVPVAFEYGNYDLKAPCICKAIQLRLQVRGGTVFALEDKEESQ